MYRSTQKSQIQMPSSGQVASHGRIVVMSLHQPSPDIVDRLDRLLVLAVAGAGPGGESGQDMMTGGTVYFGPTAAAAAHCSAAGWPCPPGMQCAIRCTSADRAVNIVHVAFASSQFQCGGTVCSFSVRCVNDYSGCFADRQREFLYHGVSNELHSEAFMWYTLSSLSTIDPREHLP